MSEEKKKIRVEVNLDGLEHLRAENERMREALVAISECAPDGGCGDCYGAEIAGAALGTLWEGEELPKKYERFRVGESSR